MSDHSDQELDMDAEPETRSRKHAYSDEEGEEAPVVKSKRRKNAAPEPSMPTFTREDDKDIEALFSIGDKEGLYCKTLHVADFVSVITGCSSIPGLDCVELTFSPQGLQIYAKPQESSVVATAFFGLDMFTEYKVVDTVRRVVEKSRLDKLKKKISKEVHCLEITDWKDGPGFVFSGHRNTKVGGKSQFTVNICEITTAIHRVDLTQRLWNWQLKTPSHTFKDNVEFIDDSNEYIEMKISPKSLTFCGIRDTGMIGESVGHVIEELKDRLDVTFAPIFNPKLLKIITATYKLNRNLNISFTVDDNALPVLFHYDIENTKQPTSHFSVYIMPLSFEKKEE
jgi:hypothetical protein